MHKPEIYLMVFLAGALALIEWLRRLSVLRAGTPAALIPRRNALLILSSGRSCA